MLILLLVAILATFWYFTQKSIQREDSKPAPVDNTGTEKPAETATTSALDVNQDGKVDVKDAVEVVKKARGRAKRAADLDGDGKVTVKDAKVAVRKTRAKVVETVAKTRGRSKKA